MGDKITLVIGGDSSGAVKALRDTDQGLAKLRESSDKAAGASAELANRMTSLGQANSKARSSSAELAASHRDMLTSAEKAAGGVGKLNQQLLNVSAAKDQARAMTAEVDRLGMSLLKIGTVGAVGIGAAVKEFATFDASMAFVRAQVGASADEILRLKQVALALGNDARFTKLSATGIGTGMGVLAQGGMAPKDIAGGGAEAAALASAAGMVEIGRAALIASDMMAIFRLQAKDMPYLIDQMVAAKQGGKATFEEIAHSMKMAGPAASAFNRDSKEVLATLALLGSRGLRGEMAGSSLAFFLMHLRGSGDMGAAKAKQLGLSFFDAAGQMKPMLAIVEELQKKLGNLSDEAKSQAVSQIWGGDAAKAVLPLIDAGAAGFQRFYDKVSQVGTASSVAKTQQDSLQGSIDALIATAKTGANVMGGVYAPSLRKVADVAASHIQFLGDENSSMGKVARTGLGLGTTLALVAGGYLTVSARVTAYRLAKQLLVKTEAETAAALGGNTLAVSSNAVALKACGPYLAAIVAMLPVARTATDAATTAWDGLLTKLRGTGGLGSMVAAELKVVEAALLRLTPAGQAAQTAMALAGRGGLINNAGALSAGGHGLAKGLGGAGGVVGGYLSGVSKALGDAALAAGKAIPKTGLPEGMGKAGKGGKEKDPAEEAKQAAIAALDEQIRILKAEEKVDGGGRGKHRTTQARYTDAIGSLTATIEEQKAAGHVFSRTTMACAGSVSGALKAFGYLDREEWGARALRDRLKGNPNFRPVAPGSALDPSKLYVRYTSSTAQGATGHIQWVDKGRLIGTHSDPGGQNFRYRDQGGYSQARAGDSVYEVLPQMTARQQRIHALEQRKAMLEGGAAPAELKAAWAEEMRQRAELERKQQDEKSKAWIETLEAVLRANAAGDRTAMKQFIAGTGGKFGSRKEIEAELARAKMTVAERQGGAAVYKVIADEAEARKRAGEEVQRAAEEAKRAEEHAYRERVERVRNAGQYAVDTAQGELDLLHERLRLQQALGVSDKDLQATRKAGYDAQTRTWATALRAALDVFKVTKNLADLDKVRYQIAKDQAAAHVDYVEQQRKEREEADRRILQQKEDRVSAADRAARRMVASGTSKEAVQTAQLAKEQAMLAVAAEKSRQGDKGGADELRTQVMEEQARRKRDGKNGLLDAVIGGDLGRVQDIMQSAHRMSGGGGLLDVMQNPRQRSFVSQFTRALDRMEDSLVRQITQAILERGR